MYVHEVIDVPVEDLKNVHEEVEEALIVTINDYSSLDKP